MGGKKTQEKRGILEDKKKVSKNKRKKLQQMQ